MKKRSSRWKAFYLPQAANRRASCIDYLPNRADSAVLRGQQRFEYLATLYPAQCHERVTIHLPSKDVALHLCDNQILWFLMPSHPNVASLIERRARWSTGRGQLSVVDYHGDVLQLTGSHVPPDVLQAGLTVPDESWQWWFHPERQQVMRDSLSYANLITTPWPHLVEPLTQFGRVALVPDWEGDGIECSRGIRDALMILEKMSR